MKRFQDGDRGAAAVEFALVSLVLIMLIFGITEFGRAWFTQATLSGAAREGVRVMALGGTADEAAGAVSTFAVGISGYTVAVGASCPEDYTPGTVTSVTIDYDFEVLVPGLLGITTIPMTGYGEMRCGA